MGGSSGSRDGVWEWMEEGWGGSVQGLGVRECKEVISEGVNKLWLKVPTVCARAIVAGDRAARKAMYLQFV